MWYMPAPPSSPRVRALATALRRARESRGLSVRAVGKQLGVSHGLVSFWETGKRVPAVEDVLSVLVAIGAIGDEKARILDLARNANSSDQNWLPGGSGGSGISPALAGVLDCEATAVAISQWSPMVIPGLLQAPAYTQAMPVDVETRQARQGIITRGESPVEYVALISQFAIEEAITSRTAHVAQLDYLLNLGARPNVTIQVVRLGQGWHPGFGGPFIIYDFADSPSIVHIEHYSASAFLYEERDVEAYKTASQEVRSRAMDPASSAEFIAGVRKKMEMG